MEIFHRKTHISTQTKQEISLKHESTFRFVFRCAKNFFFRPFSLKKKQYGEELKRKNEHQRLSFAYVHWADVSTERGGSFRRKFLLENFSVVLFLFFVAAAYFTFFPKKLLQSDSK